ncbi:MAG: thioesterase family protein [Pseudomonadota bacterium]
MQDAAPEVPSAAPIRTAVQTVESGWIDYNGHMNVAYYTLAFDRALDEIYEALDIGPSAVESRGQGPMALQTQIHYRAELLEGEGFHCEAVLLDADHKRCHAFLRMVRERDGVTAACYETLSVNVDLAARRSAPYPEAVAKGLQRQRDLHRDLTRDEAVGARIGIRRG